MKYLTIMLCTLFIMVGCTCNKYQNEQSANPVVQSDHDVDYDHESAGDDHNHEGHTHHDDDAKQGIDYERNRYNYDYHRDYTNRLHYYNRGRLP